MKTAISAACAAAGLFLAYDLSGQPVFALAGMVLSIGALVWGVKAGVFGGGEP